MWSVLHHAVLGVDRGALHQRQQVALHALAADVGTAVLGREATLSISSMKTMPLPSALASAAGGSRPR
jgi:hypothetical protein